MRNRNRGLFAEQIPVKFHGGGRIWRKRTEKELEEGDGYGEQTELEERGRIWRQTETDSERASEKEAFWLWRMKQKGSFLAMADEARWEALAMADEARWEALAMEDEAERKLSGYGG
jgi:hypothetical protein